MKNFKVCILAAGQGSRSFSPEINKALLPLDGKAIISQIIDKFKQDQKFVIALGYKSDQIVQYLKHSYPERNFEFIYVDKYFGPGSGPGHSLLCCEKKLKSPFILITSDTIVLEKIKNPNEDWLGVAPVKNTIDYCTLRTESDYVTGIEDKTSNSNKLAWIGLAGINDYKIFFKSLRDNQTITKKEVQISNGLKGLISKGLRTINYTWHDTGNIENYKITLETFEKNRIDFSKPEEFTYTNGKRIVKFFLDTKKVKYLELRWKKIKKVTPMGIKFSTNVLSYNKFTGYPVYQILNRDIVKNLLLFLKKNLWNFTKTKNDKNFINDCFCFYKNKTLERIETFYKKNSIKNKKSIINGIKTERIQDYLKKIDWKYLSQGIRSNFHGDLQFDNIIYNEKNNLFKLIDWRSDFNANTDKGDLYYDLSKLYAGAILSYHEIKKGNFNFENVNGNIFFDFTTNYSLNDSKNEIEKFIIKEKLDLNKIKLITSLIYLNMSPMHAEPFSHLLYFLGLSRLRDYFYE
jgi:choline kinase